MLDGDSLLWWEYFPCNLDPSRPFPSDIERMKKNEIPITAYRIKTIGVFRTVEGERHPPSLKTCVFRPIEHLIGKAVLRQSPFFVIALFTSLVWTLLSIKGIKYILKNHPHLQKLSYLPIYILYVAASFGINGPLFGSVSGAMILGTTLLHKSLDIPSIRKTVLPDKSSPTRKLLFSALNHPGALPLFFSTCISTGVFGSQFKSLPSMPSRVTIVTEPLLIIFGIPASLLIGILTGVITGIIMVNIVRNCCSNALHNMIQNESTNQSNSIDLPETTSAVQNV